MRQTPTLDIQPERDPLATIAVSAAPVVLEGRYRLLMRSLWQLRHSRRTRWGVGLGSAALMLLLAWRPLHLPVASGRHEDTAKGNRPSFVDAAPPEDAEPLYEAFCDGLRELGVPVARPASSARAWRSSS